MFRAVKKEDVTDEEFDKYILKQSKDEMAYLIDSMIPEFIAFTISNGYVKGYTEYNDYDIHIKTALTYFNIKVDENDIKQKVTEILKEKYDLHIISEKPLDFKSSSN